MIKRILLAGLCVIAVIAAAQAADVKMGDVTLKLVSPQGHCELDARQAADKRLIDFVSTTVSKTGNELLFLGADCTELRDWRTGKRKLLQHISQYQTQASRRATVFSLQESKSTCDQMRQQGQQLSDQSTKNVNDYIHQANKNIDFQGQKFLGVLEDDANGCYVGLFQKFKADTGDAVAQVNVLYSGSIKEREVFFYVWAPYQDDSTINTLFSDMKRYTAAMKAANGM